MASGQQPMRQVAVQSAPATAGANPIATKRRSPWWRTTLLLLLAFALVGAVPILLIGQLEGAWRLHLPGTPDYHHVTSPFTFTDATPRQAWIAVTTQVYSAPGQTAAIATLEPGFPVVVTAHTTNRGALWSHIVWQGPTASTGGNGWALGSATVAYGDGSRAIGDLGALSPALGHWASPYSARLAVALYFVDGGQLYHSNPTRSFALGSGVSPILLADLYATGEAKGAAPAPSLLSALANRSPVTDAVVPPSVYRQLGGGAGVSAFLAGATVTGVTPGVQNWDEASATPDGMLQFYAALANGNLLTQGDRSALNTLLQQANSATTATLLGAAKAPVGSFLIQTALSTQAGWDVSACGVVRLPSGSSVVVAIAATAQQTQQSGGALLSGFLAQFLTIAG